MSYPSGYMIKCIWLYDEIHPLCSIWILCKRDMQMDKANGYANGYARYEYICKRDMQMDKVH